MAMPHCVKSEQFFVAIFRPAFYYCRGLKVDMNSGALGINGKAITGLHAAGVLYYRSGLDSGLNPSAPLGSTANIAERCCQ